MQLSLTIFHDLKYRYKLSFMAAYETYELEFIVFDQKAQQLIGKPIQRLKSMYDKYETPAEISDLIGQRYTFVVKISAKKSINSDEPSFEVIYVKEQLGRQANIPVFRKTSSLTTNSSSQAVQTSLPSLIPMEPKKVKLYKFFQIYAFIYSCLYSNINCIQYFKI